MEQLELSMEDALNITQHQLAEKHKELLTALADLLWPVLRERIAGHVKAIVEDKFIGLDKDVVNEIIEQYVSDNEIITSDDLADRLSDYVEEDALEGKVEEAINYWADYNISRPVREAIKEMTFTVEVS
jgi:hypothetical protein